MSKVEKHQATLEWLEKQKQQVHSADEHDLELEDSLSSIAESIVESSDGDCDTETDADESGTISTQQLGTLTPDVASITQDLQDLLNSISSVQTVGNVNIENSTGVHIGNVTNINGNIQIIQHIEGRKINGRRSPRARTNRHSTGGRGTEREEQVSTDAFIKHIKLKIPRDKFSLIRRHTWLAQLPMEPYEFLPEPVKYVVISHTATESSEKQAINIRIVRDAQCFHIESRGWNDIAYNFLIGCDGNAYEGRGWGVVGAHTLGYNNTSIGISFIGCFMRTLPTEAALNVCKNLLEIGVKEGHIAANYKLICHCQCSPTESPGRKLFEEIQTWEHFCNFEGDDAEAADTSAGEEE